MSMPEIEPVTVAGLLAFLVREEEARQAEYAALMALPQDERVRRGYTLVDLVVEEDGPEAGTVYLNYGRQLPRLQPGDDMTLEAGGMAVGAKLVEQDDERLLVRPERILARTVTWAAEPTYVSYVELAQTALRSIDAFHGGYFLNALNGEEGADVDGDVGAGDEALLAQLETETGRRLNQDQRTAFLTATQWPATWALQGPPGTGKTQVAAYVAEAAARLGHRVLVVAQSHEAVNQVLEEIAIAFPKRLVVKVASTFRQHRFKGGDYLFAGGLLQVAQKLERSRPVVGMTVLIWVDVEGLLPLPGGCGCRG